jgi:lipopolysaccharide exporter
LSFIKQIKKNSFLANIITLISGTAIAQGILFAATPFLTRIFTPDDFGVFSVYAAIVAVLASVSSWKYELAIMLPEKDEDVHSLFILSMVATLITSVVVFLLILVFKPFLNAYITEDIKTFIWIVPLGVLFSGWTQVFISFGTKKKIFAAISVSRVSQAIGAISSQSAVGGFNLFPLGLVWGKLLGDFISAFYLAFMLFKKHMVNLRQISKNGIKLNARKYSDFPRYQSIAQFLSSLSQNLPYLMFSVLFSPQMAGFYMLTARVLHAPSTLIAKSTKEVYYQRAAEIYSKGESIREIFRKTTLGLAKLGVLPFLLIGVISPFLFAFVFGAEWETSGQYAQIIVAWTLLGFINPPATATIYILGLQKFSLKYELLMVVFRILSIYLSFLFFKNDVITVISYTIVGLSFNAYLILYVYKMTGKDVKRNVL